MCKEQGSGHQGAAWHWERAFPGPDALLVHSRGWALAPSTLRASRGMGSPASSASSRSPASQAVGKPDPCLLCHRKITLDSEPAIPWELVGLPGSPRPALIARSPFPVGPSARRCGTGKASPMASLIPRDPAPSHQANPAPTLRAGPVLGPGLSSGHCPPCSSESSGGERPGAQGGHGWGGGPQGCRSAQGRLTQPGKARKASRRRL